MMDAPRSARILPFMFSPNVSVAALVGGATWMMRGGVIWDAGHRVSPERGRGANVRPGPPSRERVRPADRSGWRAINEKNT